MNKDNDMGFEEWWTKNLGKHKGHHYDDVKHGWNACAEKYEKELALRDSWVKHHQASVESSLKEKHEANDKVKELEQKLQGAREALGEYSAHSNDCAIVEVGVRHGCTCKAYAVREALAKLEDANE